MPCGNEIQIVIETPELKHGRYHFHRGEIVFLPEDLCRYFHEQGWVRYLNCESPPQPKLSKAPIEIHPHDGVLS